jgi:AcrR family transcriptional regulator
VTRTPWGDSSDLRARKLAPGYRLPPETVARNQRWRLMAAMLACVAERGYARTTIGDLARLSGVSRTSFYNHFDSKEACFLATVDETVDFATAALTEAYERPGVVDERLEATFAALAEQVVEQPAAARVCLLEVHVAGWAAVEHAGRGTARLEKMVRGALDQSPAHAGLPPAIAQGIVGGVQKTIFTHLRLGEEEQLPELVPALAAWAASYRDPQVAIRRPKARDAPAGQPLAEHDQVERIFSALLSVVREKGYGAMTLDDVADSSEMSFSTFYSHFRTKEDAVLATYDAGIAQMFAAALPAFQRAPDWPQAVRAGLEGMLAFVAREPGWAFLGLTEVMAVGPRGMERRDNGIATFETLLAPGFEIAPRLPPVVGQAIGGALFHVLSEHVGRRGAERAPELLPTLTLLALAPFVGSEPAAAIANQRARRRAPARVGA